MDDASVLLASSTIRLIPDSKDNASIPTQHPHSSRPYMIARQKSLSILVWDEKALIFRGSTQIPCLALIGKDTLSWPITWSRRTPLCTFMNLDIRYGAATEGRYIGGVRDTSAPTDILLHLFKFKIVRLQVRAGEWY